MIELHVHHAYIHYSEECKGTSFMVSEATYDIIQHFCGHSWDKVIYTKSHAGVLETTGEPHAFVTFDVSYQVMTKGFAAQFHGSNFTVPKEVDLNFHYTPNFIYYKADYYSYYWLFYNPTSFQISDIDQTYGELDDNSLTMSVFTLHIHKFYCHNSSSLEVWKGLHVHSSITNTTISPLCTVSCQPTTLDALCDLSSHKYVTLILQQYIFEPQLNLVMNVSAEIKRKMSKTIVITESEQQYHGIGNVYPSHTYFTNYDPEYFLKHGNTLNYDIAVAISLIVTQINYIGENMNMKASDVHSLPRIKSFASEGPKGMYV